MGFACSFDGVEDSSSLFPCFLSWPHLHLPNRAARTERERMLNDVKQFLEQCTIPKIGASLTAGDLYEGYLPWCAGHWWDDEVRRPIGHIKFSRGLTKLGMAKSTIRGCVCYLDIAFAI